MQNNSSCRIKDLLACLLVLALAFVTGCFRDGQGEEDRLSPLLKDTNPMLAFADTITLDELKDHVYFLAGDEMEGRQSGSKGAQAAASYIAGHFEEKKLKGFFPGAVPYFQKFDMEKKELLESFLENERGRADNWTDFLEIEGDYAGEMEKELVFLGYGRISDFETANVEDKLVVFFSGDPNSSESDRVLDRAKIERAIGLGAVGCLLVPEDEEGFLRYVRQLKPYFPSMRYYLYKTPQEALRSFRSITIGLSSVADFFGIDREDFEAVVNPIQERSQRSRGLRTKVLMKTSYKSHGLVPTENVVAWIEGTDKKDEYIILSAHYDGRGIVEGRICNGANDNATGVAAVLEIAEAFAAAAEKGSPPRRSLVFFLPAAEELLGLGSTYYVENPLVPLSQNVANINMDPLGREDASRPGLKNHIYIYTSNNGYEDLQEARSKGENEMGSDLFIETKENYQGSDHVFFERRGVPVIAYTTAPSEDNHEPGDDAHKIQYKKLHKITRLIFATVWELANREQGVRRTSERKTEEAFE